MQFLATLDGNLLALAYAVANYPTTIYGLAKSHLAPLGGAVFVDYPYYVLVL